MNETGWVKAHLEFDETKVDFEGDADQVFESILRFLSQIYPSIRALQKIIYTPDLIKIADEITGLMEITSDGPVINPNVVLSARNAICLVLLGAYMGNKVGKLQKDTLSPTELSRLTRKARKTISNELPKLIDRGLIEKVSEGEYRITQLGIKRAEEIAGAIKEKMNLSK